MDRYHYSTSAAELAAASLGGLVQVETIVESAWFQRSKLKMTNSFQVFIEFQRAPLQLGGAYPAPHASVRHAQMSGVPVSQTAVFIRLADAGGAPLSEVATVEIESGSAMLAEVGGGGSKQAGPGRYCSPRHRHAFGL